MRYIAAILLLLAGLPAAPALAASGTSPQAEGPPSMTVAANDTGCQDGRLCFQTDGTPDELSPGENLTVTFENRANASHSAHVTTISESNASHEDTPRSAAFASVGPIGPNETENVTFTVPDADALYIWCDEGDHEAAGMWAEVPVSSASQESRGPEQGARRSPNAAVGPLVALALAVGLATHRRRGGAP